MASPWWTHDIDSTGRVHGLVGCAACRDGLQAGAEHVAVLASHGPERCGTYRLCHRHLRSLLARIPESSRAGAVASLLDTAAAAAGAHQRATDCPACSCEDIAARRAPAELACLPHLRRFARQLTWEGLAAASWRLVQVIERGRSGDLTEELVGHAELLSFHDGYDGCPVCAARGGARLQHFEWLADALHQFPSRAAGGAVALCANHGRSFAAWAPEHGQILLGLMAEAWAIRLNSLLAGLEHRPPERLVVRLARLPATLSSMADEEGRLPLADIARATLAAALRAPGTVFEHLVAVAFGAERCPACAAEDDASREAAATCRVAVCLPDLDLVHSLSSSRSARRAVGRATADRLEREAAAIRAGGAIGHSTGLAAIRATSPTADDPPPNAGPP